MNWITVERNQPCHLDHRYNSIPSLQYSSHPALWSLQVHLAKSLGKELVQSIVINSQRIPFSQMLYQAPSDGVFRIIIFLREEVTIQTEVYLREPELEATNPTIPQWTCTQTVLLMTQPTEETPRYLHFKRSFSVVRKHLHGLLRIAVSLSQRRWKRKHIMKMVVLHTVINTWGWCLKECGGGRV